MAGVELRSINNNAVITEATKPWRWLDAFGPSVTRWELYPTMANLTAATTLTGYTHTAATSGNMTLTAGAAGGELVITAGAGEDQGGQIQALGEAFYFASAWPCYFGACIALNDADQTEAFVGLAITDTTVLAGCTDNLGFRSEDETAVCNGIIEKNDVENVVGVGTLLDATYHIVEFNSDGVNCSFYFDGAFKGMLSCSATSFPNDEYLTPTIAMLTGEGTANTLSLKWAKCFQIREAA